MVSAECAAIELFLFEPIEDLPVFLELFNHNLPQDIRALSIKEVDEKFNIIKSSKIKEYIYLFSYGEKCHPFCAPIMTTILDDLDINLMKLGAQLFEGKHYFNLMMGTLIDLGKGKLTLKDIKDSLLSDSNIKMNYIAPASGLILNNIEFK